MMLRIISFSVLLILLSACELELPDESINPPLGTASSFDELVASEELDFTGSIEQKVSITAIRNGEPLPRVIFYLYTAPPEQGGEIIDRGMTNSEGVYNATINIKRGKEAIYAYTPYRDFVPAQRLSITGNPISLVWGEGESPDSDAIYRLGSLDSIFDCDPSYYQVIENKLKKLDVMTGTYVTFGSASNNYNGIGYNVEDKMIYGFQGANLWRIRNDGTETNLGQIQNFSGTSYIGDFDLDGNLYSPARNNQGWSLCKIDVDQSPLTGSSISLTEIGGSVQGIHDMAYNAKFDKFYGVSQSDGKLIEIDHKAGTVRALADYLSVTGKGAFGAVWCEAEGDIFYSRNTDGKIYNVTLDPNTGLPTGIQFLLDGESTNNNDGASCSLAPSPFKDSDNDGIPNGSDDDWEDPNTSFKSYYPSRTQEGTYAFEDFWPRKGDFDYNDLVVDYQFIMNKNNDSKITSVEISLNLQAVGAGAQVGFGISFDDIVPSQISGIEGTQTTSISNASNGCEAGQSKAVIVCFDNAHQVMGQATGKFINVEENGLQIDPVKLIIKINFTNPIESLGTINPFIISNNTRGREIHLKGYQATDLVDSSLFGTDDDASSGSTTYQTKNGLPWAISLHEAFHWPTEKTDILTAYPRLEDYVKSSGLNFTDWNSSGNRVFGKTFTRR